MDFRNENKPKISERKKQRENKMKRATYKDRDREIESINFFLSKFIVMISYSDYLIAVALFPFAILSIEHLL